MKFSNCLAISFKSTIWDHLEMQWSKEEKSFSDFFIDFIFLCPIILLFQSSCFLYWRYICVDCYANIAKWVLDVIQFCPRLFNFRKPYLFLSNTRVKDIIKFRCLIFKFILLFFLVIYCIYQVRVWHSPLFQLFLRRQEYLFWWISK